MSRRIAQRAYSQWARRKLLQAAILLGAKNPVYACTLGRALIGRDETPDAAMQRLKNQYPWYFNETQTSLNPPPKVMPNEKDKPAT